VYFGTIWSNQVGFKVGHMPPYGYASVSLHTFNIMALYKFVFNFNLTLRQCYKSIIPLGTQRTCRIKILAGRTITSTTLSPKVEKW